MQAFDTARQNMVDCQIKTSNVSDHALLRALLDVPREKFVPGHLQGIAYIDEDIPLGNGRFLVEPAVTARLIQAANVKSADIVLDVGCGAGYSSALLGALAGSVVGLERDQDKVELCDSVLHQEGICNFAAVGVPDLAKGLPEQAPYDVILINGSVAEVPDALLAQLANGGRLVAVVSDGKTGRAVLFENRENGIAKTELFDAATPFLAGFEPKEIFVF